MGWVGWLGGELMLDIDASFNRPFREFSLGRARSCHRSDHLGTAQCRVSYLHTLKVGFWPDQLFFFAPARLEEIFGDGLSL